MDWKRIERSRTKYYRMAEKQFYDALMQQLTPLIERAAKGAVIDASVVDTLLEDSPIWQKFEYVYTQVGGDFAENLARDLGRAEGMRPAYNSFLKNYVTRNCSEKVTSITNVSKEYAKRIINNVVAEATGAGEGDIARLISKELKKAGGRISNWRARTIARTEVATASNVGQQTAAESVNQPMVKKWLSTRDSNTRDPHFSADGQTAGLDGYFLVNGEQLLHPGDPSGSPGNVINCRCAVTYTVLNL
jgi:uncharacterized protein with gpF-like domain